MRDYPTPEAQDEAARLAWSLCQTVLRRASGHTGALPSAVDLEQRLLHHLQTSGVLSPEEAAGAYIEREGCVEHRTVHVYLPCGSWLEIDPLLGEVYEY